MNCEYLKNVTVVSLQSMTIVETNLNEGKCKFIANEIFQRFLLKFSNNDSDIKIEIGRRRR